MHNIHLLDESNYMVLYMTNLKLQSSQWKKKEKKWEAWDRVEAEKHLFGVCVSIGWSIEGSNNQGHGMPMPRPDGSNWCWH